MAVAAGPSCESGGAAPEKTPFAATPSSDETNRETHKESKEYSRDRPQGEFAKASSARCRARLVLRPRGRLLGNHPGPGPECDIAENVRTLPTVKRSPGRREDVHTESPDECALLAKVAMRTRDSAGSRKRAPGSSSERCCRQGKRSVRCLRTSFWDGSSTRSARPAEALTRAAAAACSHRCLGEEPTVLRRPTHPGTRESRFRCYLEL